ncbi:hypothetical protein KDW41_22215 [Burkholderia vietnamiensis]|nr:hypothetical protein [Burkholderia vietnamiensis]
MATPAVAASPARLRGFRSCRFPRICGALADRHLCSCRSAFNAFGNFRNTPPAGRLAHARTGGMADRLSHRSPLSGGKHTTIVVLQRPRIIRMRQSPMRNSVARRKCRAAFS